jgi:hypothetical protein
MNSTELNGILHILRSNVSDIDDILEKHLRERHIKIDEFSEFDGETTNLLIERSIADGTNIMELFYEKMLKRKNSLKNILYGATPSTRKGLMYIDKYYRRIKIEIDKDAMFYLNNDFHKISLLESMATDKKIKHTQESKLVMKTYYNYINDVITFSENFTYRIRPALKYLKDNIWVKDFFMFLTIHPMSLSSNCSIGYWRL